MPRSDQPGVEALSEPSRNLKMARLKEECSKLRFEKIALENTVQQLREQMEKKDAVIRELTAQLNRVSTSNPQAHMYSNMHS
jgi:hypothetical protein